MCQPKELGGKRCEPSATAKARKKLRRKLDSQETGSLAYKKSLEELENLEKAYSLYGNCVSPLEIPLPNGVHNLLNDINNKGYSPLLVGGTVRDALIGGTAPKDFDIEVYGVDIDTLSSTLRSSGYNVDEVGKSFGVLKVVTHGDTHDDIDISVPREDSLVDSGHRGFDVSMDSTLSVKEASARRDYTINAMMWDYRYNALIDPHKGNGDLERRELKHVSEAFADDPLRCIRGFQFAGRFNMTMHPETTQFCQELSSRASELSKERIATEWEKFYHKSKYPSQAMKVLREMGWNNHAPGLDSINGSENNIDSKVDSVLEISKQEDLSFNQKTVLYSSVMTHYMDKEDGKKFIQTTIIGKKQQGSVRKIRAMNPHAESTDYELRRLAQKAEYHNVTIEDWSRYETVTGNKEKAQQVLSRAQALGVDKGDEKPILMGRHIQEITDRRPGPWMGLILVEAEERQFKGLFKSNEEVFAWAKERVESLP